MEKALRRLVAMRSYMRDINLGNEPQEEIAQAVGMDGRTMQEMYHLLSIAKYDDRYVIPTASPESPRGITSLDPFGDADPGAGLGAPESCRPGNAPQVSLASWAPGERPDAMFPQGR